MTSIISDVASPNRGWTSGVATAEKSTFTTPAGDVYDVQEVVYKVPPPPHPSPLHSSPHPPKVGRKIERGRITFANGDVCVPAPSSSMHTLCTIAIIFNAYTCTLVFR